jgi:hypothetical protein
VAENLEKRSHDRGRRHPAVMNSGVTAAVIAAVVSVIVAVGSVSVTVLTTRASLQRDRDRQQAELKRTMTAKLYDRRVAVYPGLIAATEAFRRSQLRDLSDPCDYLARALARVDEWHAQEGGLMLSQVAYTQLQALRSLIRQCIEENPASERLEQFKHEIWSHKNKLRLAMRVDLGLLFDEDQRPPPPSESASSST